MGPEAGVQGWVLFRFMLNVCVGALGCKEHLEWAYSGLSRLAKRGLETRRRILGISSGSAGRMDNFGVRRKREN